jgi:hypothetical protein
MFQAKLAAHLCCNVIRHTYAKKQDFYSFLQGFLQIFCPGQVVKRKGVKETF